MYGLVVVEKREKETDKTKAKAGDGYGREEESAIIVDGDEQRCSHGH